MRSDDGQPGSYQLAGPVSTGKRACVYERSSSGSVGNSEGKLEQNYFDFFSKETNISR
jgi:hypothetical protein